MLVSALRTHISTGGVSE